MIDTEQILSRLNEEQKRAVLHTEGPLLILAGAGSGKTRVLTYRIAYLIEQGVMPWQILAITFTNKASEEMRERVDGLLSGNGADVFVSTFHKLCVRILRRDIERLGYARDFTIYDADDQRTLMKQVIRSLDMDAKLYKERAVLSVISAAKNAMKDAEAFAEEASDYYERGIAKLYEEYETQLRDNNALDFDDLLLKTAQLFREYPEVLAGYQERFRYIMVDEYQDTNGVQFELVRMLSARYRNLCVVGDDDQSIYRFRGADIENILSFERSFPGAAVIKLEQNYRSTKYILAAANEVIRNNRGRKQKKLWTENESGEKPRFQEYETAGAEADAIVREALASPFALRDQAVLYRTNAQSRLLEEKCIQRNVPYVIVGGVNFYQRKEIKDVLSYLRVMANDVDDLACERILNVPKRGIGQTTLERVRGYAASQGIGTFDALLQADRIPGIGTAAKKIRGFTELIAALRKKAADPEVSLKELVLSVRDDTGYAEELRKEGEIEAETRLENIDELVNKAVSYEAANGSLPPAKSVSAANTGASEADLSAARPDAESAAAGKAAPESRTTEEEMGASAEPASRKTRDGLAVLSAFLEEVSLLSDMDRRSDTDDVLTMMTLHAAKGLEFDKVYLCGMEEGLFPSSMSINADDPEAEIEEERRLCYVGITRARKELRLTASRERMIHGETHYEKPSRFIDEISEENCDKTFLSRKAASWESYDDDFDRPIPKRGFQTPAGAEGSGKFGNAFGGAGTDVYSAYSELTGSPARGSGASGIYGSYGGRFGNFGSLDRGNYGRNGRSGGRAAGNAAMPQKGASIIKQKPDYEAGDRVRHIKFGEGTVESVQEGVKDYEVSVAFDEVGVKRMFAGFAKLEKL